MSSTPDNHRTPYVGEGADGARRSAQIDREEADIFTAESDMWHQLRESADRWDNQAQEIEAAQAEHTGGTE